jgi:hypothetical protein
VYVPCKITRITAGVDVLRRFIRPDVDIRARSAYRQIDQNDITSDNSSVEGFWDALYKAIGRANTVIEKVPGVAALDPAERDVMLGEAHFIRALTYHNLVKFWGDTASSGLGVPIVLIPPPDIPSTSLVTRATTGEVYAQILTDLTDAETLLAGSSNDSHRANLMAVHALRARVYLYQKNWAGAEKRRQSRRADTRSWPTTAVFLPPTRHRKMFSVLSSMRSTTAGKVITTSPMKCRGVGRLPRR